MASPDNFDSLSKLQPAPGILDSMGQGADTAIKLATMSDTVQQKKTQTENMKEDLDTKKYQKAIDAFHTVARSSPTVAKALLPRTLEMMQKAGIGIDPAKAQEMVSDDYKRAQFLNSYDYLAGKAQDPEHRAQIMGVLSDAGMDDSALFKPAEAENKADRAAEVAKIRADATQAAAVTKATQTNARFDLQVERQHSAIMRNAIKAPAVDKMVTSFNNLDNALNNFHSADYHTPQQFEELQQAVKSNLGIKGQTGVHEREATSLNSLGIDVAKFNQWLSGKPVSIEDMGGQKFVEHITQLADMEKTNISRQAMSKVKTILSGHKDFYGKHPGLSEDMSEFSAVFGEQFAGAAPAVASGTTQSPPAMKPGDETHISKAAAISQSNPNATAAAYEAKYKVTLSPEQKKLFKQ